MSVAEVRQAVADWIAPPIVPGLQRVYRGTPGFVSGGEWNLAEDAGWGVVAFLHVARTGERRLTIGGEHGGLKREVYRIGILSSFKWLFPSGVLDVEDSEADAWVDAWDPYIEALKARIRSDRTLGGRVWQAGEGSADGSEEDDLTTDDDLPVNAGGYLLFTSVLSFTVVQMHEQSASNP